MLGTILDIFTSGGFGAITGLIGGWLAKREQRKLIELSNQHEQFMADHDMKRDKQGYDHALQLAEKGMQQTQLEGDIAEDVRSADAFVASVQSNRKSTGTWIGNALKSAVRPVLTAALLWVTWTIYSELSVLVGGLEGLDTATLEQLFVYVVHAIIFLTITAVAWWFASRGERAIKAIKSMIS